jgi:MtrB/PioB family decaheme-associated outer membrane protein
MRYKIVFTSLFLIFAFVLPLWPQETTTEQQGTTTSIDSEISVWTNHVVKDSSKAEEYGEVPEGFLVDHVNAQIWMKDGREMGIRATNVGLNHAIYGFDYGVSGKYHLDIDYRKIPHLFSKSGETIYNEDRPGEWRLADSVQDAIEDLNPFPVNSADPNYTNALNAQRTFVSNLISEAHPQRLGLQRNRGTVAASYSPSLHWNYGFEYFRENRDGYRPYGATFGFSWLQEMPERIDYNTDRVRAGLQYANNGRTFSAAYEFSGFSNEDPVLIWDNPLRLRDRAEQTAGDGPSQGRLQLPADNHSNMFTVSGSSSVGKGKLSGTFAYNTFRDSVDLLPYTINSALEQVPLPGSTFHGDIRNITAYLRYYAPVGTNGTFTANYRLYDESNHSDDLVFTAFAPTDTSINTDEPDSNSLIGYSSNTVDLDYQRSLSHTLRWLAGYSFNHLNREDREVDTTKTNTLRTALDWLASDRITVHARYQYDWRRSDQFNLDNATYDVIPLRRYDVANLNRNLFRVTADYSINDASTIGFITGVQDNQYPDTDFGLQDATYFQIGADYSYALSRQSTVNLWYEHDHNTRDQMGRQSGSTPSTDPNANWTAALADDFDTVGLGYQMHFNNGKYDWNTDFIYARANGKEDLGAGSAVRPTGAVDVNNVDDTQHFDLRSSVAVQLFPRAKLVIGYWLDTYTIDDFAENAILPDQIFVTDPTTGLRTTPGVILLNARQPDYTYHSGWLGFTYSW